jgi:transketolase
MEHTRVAELEKHARSIRRTVVEIIYRAKASHIGCCLSSADILTALYFEALKVDPENPSAPHRDRFVLSKGHAVAACYATLAERGFFDREKLQEYGQDGTVLASHIVHGVMPGVETSNGSGGHGLSLGVGMAIAARNQKFSSRIFVLSGDGELQEGSVWEAALFAGFHKLSNLTLIIDHNHLQDGTDGLRVEEILNLSPLDEKWRAFRWDVDIVDGHNFGELISALNKKTHGPHVVIANTIKGKGVSYMENRGEWHGKCPNEEQYQLAMKELS